MLGFAGCSGSGKTTLAEELARALGGFHFSIDNYYRDLSHLPAHERALANFDAPDLIEVPLLAAHVAALARGEAVERPLYDFPTHTRIAGRTETVHPAATLVVDGIFALHYPELLPLYDLRVYVDTPDEVCFGRRLERDVAERGRTAESVQVQYETTVRPAAERWVRPSARSADMVVNGTEGTAGNVERVIEELHRRGLERIRG